MIKIEEKKASAKVLENQKSAQIQVWVAPR